MVSVLALIFLTDGLYCVSGNKPSPPTLLFVMVFITATEKQTRTESYLGLGIYPFLLGYPT